jgi:hypothetical protein
MPLASLLIFPFGMVVLMHFAAGKERKFTGIDYDPVMRKLAAETVARPAWVNGALVVIGLVLAGFGYLYSQSPERAEEILSAVSKFILSRP